MTTPEDRAEAQRFAQQHAEFLAACAVPKGGRGTITPETTNGPRPLFPMEPVQCIRGVGGLWFVSFNGGPGHGPFGSREVAQQYARQCTEAAA